MKIEAILVNLQNELLREYGARTPFVLILEKPAFDRLAEDVFEQCVLKMPGIQRLGEPEELRIAGPLGYIKIRTTV